MVSCSRTDESDTCQFKVLVAVDVVSFPVANVLLATQKRLDYMPQCYIRYKFYDRGMLWKYYLTISFDPRQTKQAHLKVFVD